MSGAFRVYRIAARVAPLSVSRGVPICRAGRFHRAITHNTPRNDSAFNVKAVATPATANQKSSQSRPNRARQIELNAVERNGRQQVFSGHNFRQDRAPCRSFERVSNRKSQRQEQQHPRRDPVQQGERRERHRHGQHPHFRDYDQLAPVEDVAEGPRGQREQEER